MLLYLYLLSAIVHAQPIPFQPFITGIAHQAAAHLSFLTASPIVPTQLQTNSVIGILNAEEVTVNASPGPLGPALLQLGGAKEDGMSMRCWNDLPRPDEIAPSMNWSKAFAIDFLSSMAQLMQENGAREYDFEIWQSDEMKVGRCELRFKEIGVETGIASFGPDRGTI